MDWVGWHGAYDDPASSLSARLVVVRRRIGEALDAAPRDHILGLCAGDGRDLLPELAARPGRPHQVTLVELDPTLADGARARATALGLTGVEVRTADAGDPSSWRDVLPVDLLLLCGIFGNITDDDIATTVAAVPTLLAPGGVVIWTRGHFPERGADLRPAIRRWVTAAGLTELAYDGAPAPFGVGVARWAGPTATAPLPDPLFTFVR